jgi:hypothetical protein
MLFSGRDRRPPGRRDPFYTREISLSTISNVRYAFICSRKDRRFFYNPPRSCAESISEK